MSFEVVVLRVCRELFTNYAYLGADRATGLSFLVDPAWERATIEHAIQQSATRCEFILLTHAHPDHVDLADELASAHGLPVYMSRREIERSQFNCKNLQPLDEWDRIAVGSEEIEPLWTPGHTWGSFCFRLNGHLFTGDTLFTEGCGMCVGDGADPADLFHSLKRLKATLSPETRIFPGHSYGQPPGQPLARLLAGNIYLQFDREEDFIAYRMRSGQSGWANFK